MSQFLVTLLLNLLFTSAGDYPFYEELNENKTDKVPGILNISSLGVDQYARALPEPSKGGYDGADGEQRISIFRVLKSVPRSHLI